MFVIETTQFECFSSEIKVIQRGQNVNKNSKIVQATTYLDEHDVLWVIGRVTRIQNADCVKNPVILDAAHPVTRLLIKNFHSRFKHANKETVLNKMRQSYYIIGLRNILKSVIAKCIICKMRRGKPKNPIMAPLPDSRLAYSERPFTHCGVDYFGPILVKVK